MTKPGVACGSSTYARPVGIGRRLPLILALVEETPDRTLEELRAALAGRAVAVGYGTLWPGRFCFKSA